MPHKGEGKREVEMMRKRVSRREEVRMRAQVHAAAKGPLPPLHPPLPAQGAPPGLKEILK